MSSSTVSIAILATLLFVSTTMGHSQMRCAKYDPNTGDCFAPIRDEGSAFLAEAYDMTTGTNGICQSPWTNPITDSYSNGPGCPEYAPCPSPMGTFNPGETFYVQWLARNHATPDQTPGNVSLYLSPPISQTQTSDVTQAIMEQNKFCVAPFMSCGGNNGNLVNCSAECTMPSNTAPGVYTLWWLWAWPGHTSIYATCADIYVVANGASSVPSTTGKTIVAPTPSTTGSQVPSTTGAQAPATTGLKAPSTTGAQAPAQPSTTGAQAPAQPSTTGAQSVVASATTGSVSPSAPSSGSCVSGNMKCLTSETYSTCNFGSWAAAQSCSAGTQCSPSGNYVYCLAGSSPSTPISPPAQPTPSTSTTTTTTTTTTGSASSSSSCTLGYQRCTGSNTYQTCGNGRNGPVWAASQFCQTGLQCHASSTANNIYCY